MPDQVTTVSLAIPAPQQVALSPSWGSTMSLSPYAGVLIPPGGDTKQVLIKSGTNNYQYAWGWAVLSDQDTHLTVSATPPLAPEINDLWIDLS